MNENIKAFLQKLSEDQALQQKMGGAAGPDEAFEIASAVQGGFTKEEFVETMTKINGMAQNGGELSEEDLQKIAGGSLETEDVVGLVAGGVVGMVATPYIAVALVVAA